MLYRIRGFMTLLAPTEQRVAGQVLNYLRAFATLPITVFTARSHVNKPAVVKFCRGIGCDGLSDLKLKLA